MNYSIILLPQFENQIEIEKLRQRYDPLYLKIPPHITLVFPFDYQLTISELTKHIERKTTNILPFDLELAGITGDQESGYLFLTVKKEMMRLLNYMISSIKIH